MEKILILGGTGFVGRILTGNLLKQGRDITLFNRAKRNAGIFPEAKRITGDRLTDDIKQITSQNWDVVVDFSCMFPDNLEGICDMLKGSARRYIFVSTASVYPMDDPALWQKPVTEELGTLACTAEQRKDKDVMATYGPKKAECERVLLSKTFLDPVIFRPGLIYGRYDPTDRFYYWLYKVHEQQKVLIPDGGRDKCTNTYSEDFARLIEKAVDADKHNRVYNAVTHSPVSIKELLDLSCRLLNKHPEFVDASAEFLAEKEVQPWGDLPIWLGGMDLILDNRKAIKDFNISFESFEKSVQGCIDYYSSLGWPVPNYGIKAEKEDELINLLKI